MIWYSWCVVDINDNNDQIIHFKTPFIPSFFIMVENQKKLKKK